MTSPAQMPSEPYPHVSAAFINAIAEGGTKDEAVRWLQLKWNESRALRAHAESLQAEVERLRQIIDVSVDGARKQMLRAEAAEDRAEQAERKLAEAVTLIRELTILYGQSFIPSTMKKIDEVTK